MTRPILSGTGWRIRICRPAFQDFQRIWRRYYARSVLIRHLLKLRWWDSEDPFVVDLRWSFVRDSKLWVLGGLRIDDEFGDLQRSIYSARSLIVRERAD